MTQKKTPDEKQSFDFTIKKIEKLPTPKTKRATYYDTNTPQLMVIVQPTGTKSFSVRATVDGRTKRIGIGKHPSMNVAIARKHAKRVAAAVTDGCDPIADKARQRELGASEKASGATLGEMVELHISLKELKPRTEKDYRNYLDNFFGLNTPLNDITEEVVLGVATTSGKAASTAINTLKAVFNTAAAYPKYKRIGLFRDNPVAVLKDAKIKLKYARRRDSIQPEDLSHWFDAVENLRPVYRDYFLFLVLTGIRSGSEADVLQWEHIDWRNNYFTLFNTKNGTDVTLPLPGYIGALLKQRKQPTGRVFAIGGTAQVERAIVTKQSGVKFTRHDLRRTFANIANGIDVAGYTVKSLLNHAQDDSAVTSSYINPSLSVMRKASEKIEREILHRANRLVDNVARLQA